MTPDRDSKNKEKTCRWKYDEDMDAWNTQCDNAFCIGEGTPAENEMKFCPYCGRKLVEAKL